MAAGLTCGHVSKNVAFSYIVGHDVLDGKEGALSRSGLRLSAETTRITLLAWRLLIWFWVMKDQEN